MTVLILYTVSPGDSLHHISSKFPVSRKRIIEDNQLADPDSLIVGQTLILNNSAVHTIQPNETLSDIAATYGVSVGDIINANPYLKDYPEFFPLQTIVISPPRSGPIITNGYTYPNADPDIVTEALPSLTYLSIFSYTVNPDGSLQPIDDEALIEAAREHQTAPKMVITNIENQGGFSSSLAHTILTNWQVQHNLLENALQIMKEKGYTGLDVDFEYIYPDDREAYNRFLRYASSMLHDNGYLLSTAVAPKTGIDQRGLLYEAHDYEAHGIYADFVIIMTYEWGYLYGPPQAIAPINQVKRVLDYAVTVIPSNKILMGIPNYAYDWTLPFVQGRPARILSNPEAIELARTTGAEIQFDHTAESPFFYYYDSSGAQHVVWFEDPRSIRAKLFLVNRYQLGGVSYWTVGKSFLQNWVVLNKLYDIYKEQT